MLALTGAATPEVYDSVSKKLSLKDPWSFLKLREHQIFH